jgi:hypothetical protein
MSDEVKFRPHQRNFAARDIYFRYSLADSGCAWKPQPICIRVVSENIGANKNDQYCSNHLTSNGQKSSPFLSQANTLVTTKRILIKQPQQVFFPESQ